MESKCITTPIQKSMVLNFNFPVRVTDKTPEMLIKWAFPGLIYAR